MFRSLHVKLLVLIISIICVLAAGILLISKQDVERTIADDQVNTLRAVMDLVILDLNDQYMGFLLEKKAQERETKMRLRNALFMIREKLMQYHQQELSHELDQQQAQAQAANWISSLQFGLNNYAVAFNNDLVLKAHPTASKIGEDISGLTDIEGNPLAATIRKKAIAAGESFDEYKWKPNESAPPITMQAMCNYFSPWGWTIGVLDCADKLEELLSQNRKRIVQTINSTLPDIKIQDNGFVCIFDKNLELIVPPPSWVLIPKGKTDADAKNPLLSDWAAQASKFSKKIIAGALSTMDTEDGIIPQDETLTSAYYHGNLGWYVVAVSFTYEIYEPAEKLMSRQLIILSIIMLAGLGVGNFIAIRISTPMKKLTAYARQIPDREFLNPHRENSQLAELAEKRKDEVGALASAMDYMECALHEKIKELIKVTESEMRILGELNAAKEIQLGMLPKLTPELMGRPEFELHAFLESAKEVGGDLYDFFLLDDDKLFFAIGDVADKGVPAALFMASIMAMIKALVSTTQKPAEVMASLNKELSRDNPTCMFVTLFLGVLDLRTGQVDFANGAHNKPILFGPGHNAKKLNELSGTMVGFMETTEYAPFTLQMTPGQSLLLYTDGITEARSPASEQYGTEQLQALVTRLVKTSPEEVNATILKSVKDFTEGALQGDDITLLTLCYKGPAHGKA